MDTIIALSTFPSKSALAVVRMSGNKAFSILDMVFSPKNAKMPDRRLVLGELNCKTLKDSALAVKFTAPSSFTGEDMVEFHTHGSMAIVSALINHCIELGARTAQAGEFTRRAFLNGKLDLCSAEAVIDLIDSDTAESAKIAYEQSLGSVFLEINGIQTELTSLLALLEVANDYPEEGIMEAETSQVLAQVERILAKIQSLIDSYSRGRLIKNGVSVVIYGQPNVGKSSLLNAMLGFDRAIVSPIAGTTRDTVEDFYEFLGVKFGLTDTAGVRDSSDDIEKLGIERTLNALKTADLILHLRETDLADGFLDEYRERVVEVMSKSDLNSLISCEIAVSALKNHNIDALKQLIYDRTVAVTPKSSGALISSARHFSALNRTKTALESAFTQLKGAKNGDLILFDLHEAWQALGEITGQTATETIINEIFLRFCVGK